MSTYNWDVQFIVGLYEVLVDTSANYGYFEHRIAGGGGGLWFDGRTLEDCDGVFMLPKAVADGLRSQGFCVREEFD